MIQKVENQTDALTNQTFSQVDFYIQLVRHPAFCTQDGEPDTFAQAAVRFDREKQLRQGVDKASENTVKRLYQAAKVFPLQPGLMSTLWPFLQALEQAHAKLPDVQQGAH